MRSSRATTDSSAKLKFYLENCSDKLLTFVEISVIIVAYETVAYATIIF